MSCHCQPLQPPPPFDVPPPPDPSLVFHLLSDDPPETFERLHLLHSCPLQKHHFFFRPPLGRFVPLAVIAASFLLLTSFSITAFALWRKRKRRRRRMNGIGEETDGREWRRKSEERRSGRKEQKEEGRKKRRTTQAKRSRSSALSAANTPPPNGVPPPAVRLPPNFCLHLPVSSPSSDPGANSSCRSSTETVSSVPSLAPMAANEWPFQRQSAECDIKVGSNVFHSSPAVAFATPPRRSVALCLLPNRHLSPDFVWRSPTDYFPNDLYEELAVTDGEIAEAPYKWRRTLTPSASARRLPPPSSKPPPPPTDYPTDCHTSIAHSSANGSPNAEINAQQEQQRTNDVKRSRWRTPPDFLDKERESGYGTGRSGRRERSQNNGSSEERDRRQRCSSTSAHPCSFPPLPNMHIQSPMNNGSSTPKKLGKMSVISNPADGTEKLSNCKEKGQAKTMTYL